MQTKRVVITGIGAVSAFGRTWDDIRARFAAGQNAVRYIADWESYPELETKLGAPVPDYAPPAHWTRKQLRSMGPLAQYCTDAAEQALAQAGLLGDPAIRDGRMGVAAGSSSGSTADVLDIGLMLAHQPNNFSANTYVRMMPHTTAANVAIFFGLTGRLIPTSSACTSGSQGIGYAYEAIKFGKIPMMLAGGADQLCPSEVFVFDTLYAASRRNGEAALTPRPYDAARDGLVLGEGGCMMVLEELEHARARGADIIAEIVGYGVSGHGTATEHGDIAETRATAAVFGRIPISSQKSYLGHTLGACGALESWFAIEMMRDGRFFPTLNLDNPDPRCGDADYIAGSPRAINTEYVMNNNFAFGGVNTSLIFKRWAE